MKKSVLADFQKLLDIEKELLNKRVLLNSFFSEYAFIRPSLFKVLSGDLSGAVRNSKSIILQFLFAPLTLPKLAYQIFFKRGGGLVFCTERNDTTNSCRYINCVPSIQKSKYLKLRYSINHTPKLFDNVLDIAPFILVTKVFSRLNIIKADDRKVLKYINELSQRYNSDCSKMLKNKLSEYRFLEYFFRALLFLHKPKRIIFVSNNFFIPLINLAKKKSVPTYEVAHALTHKYHPNYSYENFDEHPFYPDYLIESNLAFNIKIDFLAYKKIFFNNESRKMDKFIKERKKSFALEESYDVAELFGSLDKKILIIGQGLESDTKIISKIKPHINNVNLNKVTFREHPAFKGKLEDKKFKISTKSLEEDLDENDIIIVDYSQVMLVAHFMKKEIVAVNEYWFKAIDSTGIIYKKLNYD